MTDDMAQLILKQPHAIVVHHRACAGVMRYMLSIGAAYARGYAWWYAERCPYIVLSCITADELRNKTPAPFMCADDDELREVVEQEEQKCTTPIQWQIIVGAGSEYEATIRHAITSDDIVRVDVASMTVPEPKPTPAAKPTKDAKAHALAAKKRRAKLKGKSRRSSRKVKRAKKRR